MNRLISLSAKTLSEFISIIDDFQDKSDGHLWYRGSINGSYPLLPGIYRKRVLSSKFSGNLSDLEKSIYRHFIDRSIPYNSREMSRVIDNLFYMQHFGLPTRLLDWSENPFVGLYFALRKSKYKEKSGKIEFIDNAAVWVLAPKQWNQGALPDNPSIDGPLDRDHPNLNGYNRIGEVERLQPIPVALHGAHNSPRIVAQQGTFVLFGSQQKSMQQVFRYQNFDSVALRRIVIGKQHILKMRDSLYAHGITESTLFPDLEGLSRDLRVGFGFEV